MLSEVSLLQYHFALARNDVMDAMALLFRTTACKLLIFFSFKFKESAIFCTVYQSEPERIEHTGSQVCSNIEI